MKYRIVKNEYENYEIQRKFFGVWFSNVHWKGFDSIEEAEDFYKRYIISKTIVVKEY